MTDIQQRLIQELMALEDELDIYDYFIEKAICYYCPDIREESYKIEGCVSGLWVKAEVIDNEVRVFADSDSLIIRGIAACVCEIYNGLSVAQTRETEIVFLDGYDLAGELNETRRSGLNQMIQIIKSL